MLISGWLLTLCILYAMFGSSSGMNAAAILCVTIELLVSFLNAMLYLFYVLMTETVYKYVLKEYSSTG